MKKYKFVILIACWCIDKIPTIYYFLYTHNISINSNDKKCVYIYVCNKRLLSFCAGDAAPVRHLSLKSLLPDTNGYMTYEGSTTHPGCWETAVWLILNKPIYVTAREVSVDPLYSSFHPPQFVFLPRPSFFFFFFIAPRASIGQLVKLLRHPPPVWMLRDDPNPFLEQCIGKEFTLRYQLSLL